MKNAILLTLLFAIVLMAGCTHGGSPAVPITGETPLPEVSSNIIPETEALDVETSDIPNATLPSNVSTEPPGVATNLTTPEIPKLDLNLSAYFLEENLRWRTFPIKVYIEEKTCSNTQLVEIKKALEIWERTTVASFSLTDNKNTSKVVTVKCYPETRSYYLKDEFTVGQKLGEAAPTYVKIGDFHVLDGGHVNIYLTTIACINPQRHIHEFGHILGLNHTDGKDDIMYPYEDCNQEIKPETIEVIERIYSDEVNVHVENLFRIATPTCAVNTTLCGGKCWPSCSENYTINCDDIEPYCAANWTKINALDWTKFDDYKIECNSELYPPCEGDQMFICDYKIAYCMGRKDFELAAWWTRCPVSDNLYCDGACRSPCLGVAHCTVDTYQCEPKGN